jgi:toxin ParE1/3/4
VKDFRIEAVAQTEFEEAAVWYEAQREGLGFEFITEVDRVLVRIAHEEKFATAPIATVEGGVVRREFVERFPYVVLFVETNDQRRVIMIRRGTSDPARWRSRV